MPKIGKEGNEMPCPYSEISIVQRSQRQSAVAAAAYQSGEKLFCEYDREVKHYPEKRGIVHNEILLPAMPRRSMQTATLYGTLPKLSRSNGTPSLPGGGCFPSQERYHPTSTLPLSGSSASSNLFPKECAWILPSMTKGMEILMLMLC